MTKLTESDVDLIIALYTTPKEDGTYLRQSDIAPRFGVSSATVSRALIAAGISGTDRKGSGNRKLSENDVDRIVELYTSRDENGLWRSSTAIGDMFGVTRECVFYHLGKRGVPSRESRETQVGHAYRPSTNKPPDGEAPPLCKCRCGKRVKWDKGHRRWYKYRKNHYRPKKKYHSRDWLVSEYVEKGRPATDIADECGVAPSAVYKRLRKFGIERRTTSESLKLSGGARGEKNPAWKGGVADWDYAYNWKSIARSIRKRDRRTCRACGKSFMGQLHRLHVHHVNGDKTDNRDENLVSLCAPCHRSVHRGEPVIIKPLHPPSH